MLPLHCKQCGRLMGRAEKNEIDGKTVCPGCFDKLGGNIVHISQKETALYTVLMFVVVAIVLGLIGLWIKWVTSG